MCSKLAIGQSGGPTQVINASLAGALETAKKKDCFKSIVGMANGIEGILNNHFYDIKKLTYDQIEKLKITPSAFLGSCRYKLSEKDYEIILNRFVEEEITDFLYIGGNDSMDTCDRIDKLAQDRKYPLHIIGIPKTVDNDLVMTDNTPGYGSAAKFVAICTRDAGLDLESMSTFDDVTILEVMGRNSGWLAAASALAKQNDEDAPHLIYFPERNFNDDAFLEDVISVHKKLGRVFVVVCEGIHYSDGKFVGLEKIGGANSDAFGHQIVAFTHGVSSYLSDLVTQKLSWRSRFLRPGVMGRSLSACVSKIDQKEAFAVGEKAIQLIMEEKSGLMVSITRVRDSPYKFVCDVVSLKDVANQEKKVPDEFIDSSGNMATPKYINYALPLIDGSLKEIIRVDQRSKLSM